MSGWGYGRGYNGSYEPPGFGGFGGLPGPGPGSAPRPPPPSSPPPPPPPPPPSYEQPPFTSIKDEPDSWNIGNRNSPDPTDDLLIQRNRRPPSPGGFGGGYGHGGGFGGGTSGPSNRKRRNDFQDYDRGFGGDRNHHRDNNYKRERYDNYSDNYNDSSAGFGGSAPPVPRSIMKQTAPGPYDRSQFPPKGSLKIQDETEPKIRPAVYELPKIQRKKKDEDEPTDPNEKLAHYRMEHAKLEMRIQQLDQLIVRTIQKENEIKRNFKGVSLQDNKEFVDNMKLKMDAQRKLEEAKKDYQLKDVIIKKLLEPKKNDYEDDEGDGNQSKSAASSVSAIHFLDTKREDVVEEQEDATNKYEFFDAGDHWCSNCNYFASNVKEFLEHLQGEEHTNVLKNMKPKFVPPWPILRRNPSIDPDRTLAALKGTQFIVPCQGFYCSICRTFCGDIEAAEEHLHTLVHNKCMMRYNVTKPEYEFIYNQDRQKARAQAEADKRKKDREATEKRLKDEENRKKREEEEKRKREREDREKRAHDQLQKIKELERIRKDKDRRDIKREKDRDRDRDRDKKDKRRIHISSDSSDSSDSDIEVVGRSSGKPKERHEDDPKIKAGCSVGIPHSEARQARKAFEKAGRIVPYLQKFLILQGTLDNQKWASYKAGSSTSNPDKDDSESQGKKSVAIPMDFDDDDDKDSGLDLSSLPGLDKVLNESSEMAEERKKHSSPPDEPIKTSKEPDKTSKEPEKKSKEPESPLNTSLSTPPPKPMSSPTKAPAGPSVSETPEDGPLLITGDMTSPKKAVASAAKAIMFGNMDSPIMTLGFDALTQSPKYGEEDGDE